MSVVRREPEKPPEGVILPAVALPPWEVASLSPPRMLTSLLSVTAGRSDVSVTYARAWGRKLTEVERAPDEDGGEMRRRYVPHPLESVALRVRGVCWLAWTRLEGDRRWKPSGAMIVWQRRARKVTHTQAKQLLIAQLGGDAE